MKIKINLDNPKMVGAAIKDFRFCLKKSNNSIGEAKKNIGLLKERLNSDSYPSGVQFVDCVCRYLDDHFKTGSQLIHKFTDDFPDTLEMSETHHVASTLAKLTANDDYKHEIFFVTDTIDDSDPVIITNDKLNDWLKREIHWLVMYQKKLQVQLNVLKSAQKDCNQLLDDRSHRIC